MYNNDSTCNFDKVSFSDTIGVGPRHSMGTP